jgi:hypothetical protein
MAVEAAAKEKKADLALAVGSKNQKALDPKELEMTLSVIAKDQLEILTEKDSALLKAEEMIAEKALHHLVEKEDLLATDLAEEDLAALVLLAADRHLEDDQAALVLLATDPAAADLVAVADQATLQIQQNAGISV